MTSSNVASLPASRLPAGIFQKIKGGDWEGLADAFERGLSPHLTDDQGTPLFYLLLASAEGFRVMQGETGAEPLPERLQRAMEKAGLGHEAPGEQLSSTISVLCWKGQWSWAERLISQGWPLTLEGQRFNPLALIHLGRTERAKFAFPIWEKRWTALDGGEDSEKAFSQVEGVRELMDPENDELVLLAPDTPEEYEAVVHIVQQVIQAGVDPWSLAKQGQEWSHEDRQLDPEVKEAKKAINEHMDAILKPRSDLIDIVHQQDEPMLMGAIQAGVDMRRKCPHSGNTLLEVAVMDNADQVVQFLVDHLGVYTVPDENASLEGQPLVMSEQRHPLLHAAMFNSFDSLKPIVAAMSQPPYDQKVTLRLCIKAMVQAAYHGHLEVMRHLRALGVPYNLKSTNGDTLMHFACHAGQERVVEFLLKRQLNLDIPNQAGVTPGDLLRERHPDIAEKLGIAAQNVVSLFKKKRP